MKTAKLGVIFLASVLALTGVGVGFACWSDAVTVTGEVSTGSVSWHFTGYSGTWVYKDLANDQVVVLTSYPGHNGDGWKYYTDPTSGHEWYLVGWCYAEQNGNDKTAYVDFDNIFPMPGYNGFSADVYITYTGTVPGKIQTISYSGLGDLSDATITVTATVNGGSPITNLQGIQLHQGDVLHVTMCINPGENTQQGYSGTFSASAEIVQWNEYQTP